MDLAIRGTAPEKSVGASALNQLAKSDLLGLEEESFLGSVIEDLRSIVVDSAGSEEDTETSSELGGRGDDADARPERQEPQ